MPRSEDYDKAFREWELANMAWAKSYQTGDKALIVRKFAAARASWLKWRGTAYLADEPLLPLLSKSLDPAPRICDECQSRVDVDKSDSCHLCGAEMCPPCRSTHDCHTWEDEK